MEPGDQNESGNGPSETIRIREQTLPAGYRLHEYVISKVIGSGGFGVTYFGRDTNLDKAVAIKEYFPFSLASRYDDQWVAPNTTVQDDQSEYDWGLSRFIDEARTLAKFEHPNLIRVVRYIEENGTAYIVMDFAEGRPLSTVVNEDGLLSEDQLKPMLLPLLDGLSLVHAADMLHRDVKPENIIIRSDGTPVLIDFGAARQAIGSRSRPISTILTPGYAPYEQYFSSGNQGPWTDIYALGAVSYACLTGEAPHEAVQRAVEDPTTPTVEAAKGRGSKQFLEAVDWAIRPREGDRPQTVAEWRAALEGGAVATAATAAPTQRMPAGGAATPPHPTPKKEKQSGFSGLQAAVVLGALAVVGGGGYFAWDLTTTKGGFVNQEQARSESKPAPEKVEKPKEPAKPKVAERTPQNPPSQQRVTPPQRTPPQVTPQRTPPQTPPVTRRSTPESPQRQRQPRTPTRPQLSPEQTAQDNANFAKAQYIGTPEAYALYLRLHPAGLHAAKAKRRTR